MAESRVEIEWAQTAADALRRIGNRAIQRKIVDKVEDLRGVTQPEQIGKPLQDELRGLYRLPFGRYRILYRVIRTARGRDTLVRIQVAYVGIRKEGDKIDVYQLARKLRRRGLI